MRRKQSRHRCILSWRKAKKTSKKKKKAIPKDKSTCREKSSSTLLPSDELLLVSRACIKISCNTKHGTDKHCLSVWRACPKTNSINKTNVKYDATEIPQISKLAVATSSCCIEIQQNCNMEPTSLLRCGMTNSWTAIVQGWGRFIPQSLFSPLS